MKKVLFYFWVLCFLSGCIDSDEGDGFDHITSDYIARRLQLNDVSLLDSTMVYSGVHTKLNTNTIGHVYIARVSSSEGIGIGFGVDGTLRENAYLVPGFKKVFFYQRKITLYLDTDQNSNTGYSIGGIGADVKIAKVRGWYTTSTSNWMNGNWEVTGEPTEVLIEPSNDGDGYNSISYTFGLPNLLVNTSATGIATIEVDHPGVPTPTEEVVEKYRTDAFTVEPI